MKTFHIHSIRFIHAVSKRAFDIHNFKHPELSDQELFEGTRLGFDTWADTSCAGRHAYIESFIEGKSVNAVGFSSSLGSLKNLPIVNAVYAYDYADGQTVLLENFHAIYVGEDMEDSLANPIQCEDNNVRIDMRPKWYYPHLGDNCQNSVYRLK